jgi:hypothetical protein
MTRAQADAGKPLIDGVLAHGGVVLVSVRHPGTSMDAVNRVLPAPVTVSARTATSLIHGSAHRWTAGWSLADLYFAENPNQRQIMACGLGGAFVKQGTVLLTASTADWTLFNDVSEGAKCAAMVLYGQLTKPDGAALVVCPHGTGQIAITTIDPLPRDRQYVACWRTMLELMGVRLRAPQCTWYLPIAPVSPVSWHYTTTTPSTEWTRASFDDQAWQVGAAGFGTDVPKSRVRTAWTSDDIWLRTTFDVTTVAQEPLHLVVHHDEDVEVYLNGERIFSEAGYIVQYKDIPLSEQVRATLHTGRNQISVHCHQTVGGQYIDVGLASGLVLLEGTENRSHDLLLNGPTN